MSLYSDTYEYLNPSQNKYGNLELETYSSTQVVTTAELKSQLRIDSSTEDTLLATYISAATMMAENYCNRHFINADYKLWFNEMPSKFSLYYPDCTIDADPGGGATAQGAYRLTATGLYSVMGYDHWYCNFNSNPNTITFNDSVPESPIAITSLGGTDNQRYYFTFTTGFGTAASDVPDAIKQAIKLIAGDMYYFREDRKRAFPMASEILLQPYKCYL